MQLLSTYLQTDSLSEAEAIFNEGKELNPMSDWFMLGSFVSFKLKDYNATIKNCIEGIKLSNNDKSIAQFSAQIGDAVITSYSIHYTKLYDKTHKTT